MDQTLKSIIIGSTSTIIIYIILLVIILIVTKQTPEQMIDNIVLKITIQEKQKAIAQLNDTINSKVPAIKQDVQQKITSEFAKQINEKKGLLDVLLASANQEVTKELDKIQSQTNNEVSQKIAEAKIQVSQELNTRLIQTKNQIISQASEEIKNMTYNYLSNVKLGDITIGNLVLPSGNLCTFNFQCKSNKCQPRQSILGIIPLTAKYCT